MMFNVAVLREVDDSQNECLGNVYRGVIENVMKDKSE